MEYSFELVINDSKIKVFVHKKNNKNMYIRMKDDGNLYVTAPYFISKNKIISFIRENAIKINKWQKEHSKDNDINNIYYLGKKYKAEYILSNNNKVEINDDIISIYIKNDNDEYIRGILDSWYKAQAKIIYNDSLNKIYDIIKRDNFPYPKLGIRKMKKRWGTCYPNKKLININLYLIKKDISLIDYVILHEMCHFKEANHQKKFWWYVEKYMPNYKYYRKQLRNGD